MAICVAGMARSGTSLAAQLLRRCGVDFGPEEQLMKVTRQNAEGFWENLRFIGVNDKLLASQGGTWYAPPKTVPRLERGSSVEREALDVVAQFSGREPWAWKDPRNTLTLPFWQELLPDVKIIVCIRHPAEASASLAVSGFFPRTTRVFRDVTSPSSAVRLDTRGFGPLRLAVSGGARSRFLEALSLELWRIYNERALDTTAPGRRLVTHYDAHFTRPKEELARILDFAGVKATPEVIERHARTASERLRHHRADKRPMPDEIRALYERLCAAAEF